MSTKDQQIQQLIDARNSGKSICFVSGNFNIIHPGHLRFLLFASEQADILVVGLYDRKDSLHAFFDNEERVMALQALSCVDDVIVVNGDRLKVIEKIQPDVVVKGKEFASAQNPETPIVETYGGRLIFSSGDKLLSSRELLLQQINEDSRLSRLLQGYHERYNISRPTLEQHLDKFSALNIAVIGDIIVDEYQECMAIGMSQEDPTIAVSPLESFSYLGGAGIVAGHGARLGANVTFFSVCGEDKHAAFAKNKLEEYGIDAVVKEDTSRPTTHKLRYRAKDKTLLRVNEYRRHDIDSPLINSFVNDFEQRASSFDLVLFADFNYGLLCPELVTRISHICHAQDIPIAADSQTSSQMGDLGKFKGLMLTAPTELEARQTIQDESSGLIEVSKSLSETLDAKNVLVTLGGEGVLIRHLNPQTNVLDTDNLPAFADSAIDTAGAGDAMFVTTALMLASGANIWQAAFVGSISSSIQVSVRGNVPISKSAINKKLSELLN
ncbi:PfkB family carbohydrate kinase [Alteromonas sp. KUL49]|uniref:PfkB family carbohydrate kinase n=1 Tax=Alteromonas sp. KUL49 TaxID=2480798 RepID=UPI00102EF8BD|nr:PfkB family carbohydrate kinase [Alteromonas sp. KUL49]TAP39693.1 ADP-heptose synthase [Alteromonas sp. KUL49]GEA11681.1 bifunctional protein HldE [Alteromonas sp. KUL49]